MLRGRALLRKWDKIGAVCMMAGLLMFVPGPQDDKPYGYSDKTGYPGAYSLLGAGGGGGSVYDDATACWSFNDPTDLGNDDCTDTYDLTLVNTPTATGGALGYGADLENGSAQYAHDSPQSMMSSGAARTVVVWWTYEADGTNGQFWSLGSSAGDGSALFRMNVSGSAPNKTLTINAGGGSDTTAGFYGNGERRIAIYEFDGSTSHKVYVDETQGTLIESLSVTGADSGNTTNFYLGTGAAGSFDGVLDTAMVYNAAVGATVRASLFNSGKGKTCADLEGAELTNLVSCWDMDEDGGPYADSIGSNNLTGVNTPTQAAGLVERSDSGMSANLVAASSQVFTVADAAGISFEGKSFTVNQWATFTDNSSSRGLVSKDDVGANREFYSAFSTGTSTFLVSIAGSADLSNNNGGVGLSANTWYMLTFWWDVSDGKLYSEINAANQVSAVKASFSAAAAPLWIGGIGAGFTAYHQGQIDNPAIWAGVPGDGTVPTTATLYNSGAGTFYSAYWDAIFDGPRFAWSDRPQTRRIYIR